MDKVKDKDAQQVKKAQKSSKTVEKYQRLWEEMLVNTDILIQKIRGKKLFFVS
jgi:hypothetical protein